MLKKIILCFVIITLTFSQISVFSADFDSEQMKEDRREELRENRVQVVKKRLERNLKVRYKKMIDRKYGERLEKLGVQKLKKVSTKISILKTEVTASFGYTDKKKRSILLLLSALQEVVQEKISYIELDIESLMN